MSKEYEGQDPLAIAKQAEQDMNTHNKIQGKAATGESSMYELGAFFCNPLTMFQPTNLASTPMQQPDLRAPR